MKVRSYRSTDLRRGGAIRFRTAAVLAACFIGGMIVPAPLQAQVQPTFDYSPTSGPIGTEISVSGVCTNDNVRMFLQRVFDDKVFAAEVFPVNAEGDWSGTVVVPSEDPFFGDPTTAGAYELRGDCRSVTDPTLNILYEFEPFEVTVDGDGGTIGVDQIVEVVEGLPLASLRSNGPGLRTAMMSILSDIEEAIASDDLEAALERLQNLRRHTDGCGEGPDPNDWVRSCDAQGQLVQQLDAVIASLHG